MTRSHRLALVAILLLAGGLRLAGLDSRGLDIDEGFSIGLASLDLPGIVAGTAADQHPPLYYLLLHAWMSLAGDSLVAVRLPSALAGWLTVGLAYLAGRRFRPSVGLLAAGLLAVSPAHLWFSQETRMYALLVFLGTLSTWLAWRWWTTERGRGWPASALYAAVTLAAVYTHNFAFFLIAAQNIAGLLFTWPRQSADGRPPAGRWLLLQLVIAAGYLPWLPTAVDQALHHRMTWIGPLTWTQLRAGALYLLYGRDWAGTWVNVLALLLGAGLLLAAAWPLPGQAERRERLDQAWLLCWLWAPLLLIIGAALRAPLYQNKQLLIALPPLAVLLACGVVRLRPATPAPRPWRVVGLAVPAALAAVLLLLTAPALARHLADPPRQRWDELAAYVAAGARPGDVLYLNPAAGRLTLDYYLPPGLTRAGYPPAYSLLRGGWAGTQATAEIVSAELAPLAERHTRLWLIEFYPGLWDPADLIGAWLADHGRLLDSRRFGDLGLRLFSLEAAP